LYFSAYSGKQGWSLQNLPKRAQAIMIDSKSHGGGGVFPTSISRTQCRDTGMAMTLIALIVAVATREPVWMYAAIAVLVVNMTVPVAFKPLGYLWFGLSGLMGAVVSRILLTVLFFVLVTPVGLWRRAMGKDTLRLRQWKKGKGSVFVVRDHTYVPQDVEQPF
jgi:multisubunit Na+/H+ antiporter MnhG subunit